ncbi:exosortase/archaeosortase family protein [Nesterenkonia alba]|uniref:exosortase/archaeosortase family protein n=1 Tax=Nesterenkonia alba TaxID=515814 RepID=UPI0003B6A06A|nr:exosortase/archaeosortase family protein [Nesterenkonia alba]
MSTPNGENGENQQGQDTPGQGQDRPQPQYGQYAPREEGSAAQASGSGQQSGNQESSNPYNPYAPPSWGQQSGQGSAQQPHWGQPSSGEGSAGSGYASSGQYGSGQYGSGQYSSAPYGSGYQGGGYSSQPQYPGAVSAPTEKPSRPGTMMTAMWLMLAAAVTSLVWGIWVLVSIEPNDLRQGAFGEEFERQLEQQMQNDPELQDLTVDEAFEVYAIMLGLLALGWAFFLLAVYITFAFVGTMAGNVGRILASIWLGLSLFFLLPIFYVDGGSMGLVFVTVALSLVALIMLWLGPSNRFVSDRKAYKDAQRSPQPAAGYQQQGYSGGQPGSW